MMIGKIRGIAKNQECVFAMVPTPHIHLIYVTAGSGRDVYFSLQTLSLLLDEGHIFMASFIFILFLELFSQVV